MTPAEEAVGTAVPGETSPALEEHADAGVGAPQEYSLGSAGEAAPNEAVAQEVTPPIDADPWQALVQVGVQLVSALAAGNDPAAPAHPWIERDPATGVRNLKVPLPPPETARRLGDALSALANALKGNL
jgi:hypothetical protein